MPERHYFEHSATSQHGRSRPSPAASARHGPKSPESSSRRSEAIANDQVRKSLRQVPAKAGLTEAQIASLVTGGPDDDCWSDEDRTLIRLCDGLQQNCAVDDDVWTHLTAHHSDAAILELLMLVGTYRTVSYLVNGLRLPLESGARRFPA